MSIFLHQLKWQLLLLHKNSIVTISLAVTFIYGLVLYGVRDAGTLDQVLVTIVLNDPSVIGYFFLALSFYTEMKHGILPAIFVSPLKVHQLLIARVLVLSIIGTVCSLGLAFFVKGMDFAIWHYAMGSFGICVLSALLGITMLTFAEEFLNFAMKSIPVFLLFANVPMLQYLGVMDLGWIIYLFPIQGSLNLIAHALSGTEISFLYAYGSLFVFVPVFYLLGYHYFTKRVVQQ